jgi:hypothetical protein
METGGLSIMTAVLCSLVSGLVGALITMWMVSRREQRRFKTDTLKRFVANRNDLQGDEFSRALNEIFIVFNDVPEVMKHLGDFHAEIVSGKARQNSAVANDYLVKLFKAMCDHTKIKIDHFNDSYFLTPFNTKLSSTTVLQNPTVGQLEPKR